MPGSCCYDGVAAFRGIDEHTAKECNVRQDRVFVSVTVNIVVSLGTKLAKLRRVLDFTGTHHCTFVPLGTGLSCTLDHSSTVFALAQVVPHNRVAFDSAGLHLCVSLSLSL